MRKTRLVITKIKNLVFSLLYDKTGTVTDITCEDTSSESILGNIYIGKVASIVQNINAAFIEYSPGINGYFPTNESAKIIYLDKNRGQGSLKKGDEVIVQISKDAFGSKEAVLSSDISLVGKYVIMTLTNPGLHFSHKFKDDTKKKSIKDAYNPRAHAGVGFIIRTNSNNARLELILDEIEYFTRLWMSIRNSGKHLKCFARLYKSPCSYISCVRDTYDENMAEILTDDKTIYNEIKNYLNTYQPLDLKKLKLYKNLSISLIKTYNVRANIEGALKQNVWLKSGGYIVIQPTEALVSIDVNTGKYVSRKDSEKEFLKINKEAAKEIARQLRLRNLSGIIVVDFINMKKKTSRESLLAYIDECLSSDPQKTNLVDMTGLELVEITRKKERKPLYRLVGPDFFE